MLSTRGIGVGLVTLWLCACSSEGERPGAGGTTSSDSPKSSSQGSQTSVAAGGSGGASATSSTGAGGLDDPRADVPAIACTDAIADVYVTPHNLPPMTDSERGVIVRCANDASLSPTDVAAQAMAVGVATPMTSGVSLFRLAFRTERGDGSPGISTARVYLPSSPRALPLPVIVIGHPTDGIADACAPSADANSNRDLALPWAGLGYAVIVPDYAGLGNEGTQSYLDNRDQAHSLLDGARALRKLLSPGALSTDILAVGFSQGGGAVLSAQAIAKSYGADGELKGAIAFAPQWPTRANSFGFVDLLEHPEELTILTGISANVVAVMRTYAYFYNALGPTHAGDGFPSSTRAGIDGAVESLCQTPLGGYLQATAVHVGDIFDETFRTTLLACIDSQGQDAACVEPAKSYYERLVDNAVTADPNGAKVLYVQGLADYIMPAASEAACNIVKLQTDGVSPVVCVDALAQHETVVARNIDFAMAWGLALLDHHALPVCSSAGMPTCLP